jgi:hypothetical protein
MKAARSLFVCLSLLLMSAPAHAHDSGALMVGVAMASAPILLLIFLPIFAMSGMEGRRWKALGLYVIVLVIAALLQTQSWYDPFSRLFPDPARLRDYMPEFILMPPFDMLLWLALGVLAIYLVLRDRSVPIGLALPPVANLLRGSIFSVAAIALWSYVLFGSGVKMWMLTWPEGIKAPFFLVWVFIVPVVMAFIAIRLFRGPAPRYGDSEGSEAR